MGSLLLQRRVPRAKRYALPNMRGSWSTQPSGGAQGQATDIEIQAKEILSLRRRLNGIYVHHTGQSLESIESRLERDSYMSAEEARDFVSSTKWSRAGRHRPMRLKPRHASLMGSLAGWMKWILAEFVVISARGPTLSFFH